ncbi:HD-GYP domain-containing protein [Thioalkalivibrio sp. ALE12]|uniref:HD-GYP domain-containing protein n=1 Tax=Thioalkalivibrio sp. ALE12 TaxID=1158170 RepID=UPI0006869B20|nr:HD-GYP domain-containing protein [Thioalkalivibrio sp. ALE12]
MSWGLIQQEIPVEEIRVGMYVSQLDRPWRDTPYWVEGILIRSQEDIDELARHCRHVYVDREKSAPESLTRLAPATREAALTEAVPGRAEAAQFRGMTVYRDQCSVDEEFPAASEAWATAGTILDRIRTEMERNPGVRVAAAREASEALRESVERNPDALLLLARLRDSGDVLYDHSLRVSVHLLALGRHLGLDRGELSILGLGGLLMDVGKMQLSPALLERGKRLSPDERREMQRHVEYGEQILQRSHGIPDKVCDIVLQHHEREDGRGYPRGLVANEISACARMAAIVDSYEELLADRRLAGTPFEALKELREHGRWGLNSALVDQFTHCVGLFPVGSLVELDSGEVAIVLSHRRTQRFMPRVMRILDPQRQPYPDPLELDLGSTDPESEGAQRQIVRDLPAGAYGVDPARYYL